MRGVLVCTLGGLIAGKVATSRQMVEEERQRQAAVEVDVPRRIASTSATGEYSLAAHARLMVGPEVGEGGGEVGA